MKIAHMITKYRKTITVLFFILSISCAIISLNVKVNYTLADYLPEDAPSTVALNLMQEEFDEAIPNERVMIQDVSVTKALEYKEKLKAIDGVTQVMWLDDIVNLKQPVQYYDKAITEGYYKDGNALFQLTVEKGQEKRITKEIYALIGDDNAVDGEATTNAFAQMSSVKESVSAMLILIPVVMIILSIMSSSWFEPFLYLAAIGMSVLINMGTNILLGEISYVTQAISPILQMAVSLDYAIFLMHCFDDERNKISDLNEAMSRAIVKACPSITASAATTLFGFMALMFMRFKIGADLGLNLVKGIVFSYISVMVFLPAFTLVCIKITDKTRHKKIVPHFNRAGRVILRIGMPLLVLLLVIIGPCYKAQKKSDFIYGMGQANANLRLGKDNKKITDTFGSATSMVVMVPKGNVAREKLLCEEIKQIEDVTAVISYADTVGSVIPEEFLSDSITENFYSDNYARIIISLDTPDEGTKAFNAVEAVRKTVNKYTVDMYNERNYITGQSVVLYDMKYVVSHDTPFVNGIAIVAILLVLMFTFKSITILLPAILIFIIEAAIWINLAVPYFTDTSLVYIGFLVINTVQLGATIDYAIFVTDNYMANRKKMVKKEAVREVVNNNIIAIVISATNLSAAGLCLNITSSNPIVADLGMLLCRGTLLSLLLVTTVLPLLLVIFDKWIGKTTYKSGFCTGVELCSVKEEK